MSQAKVGGNFDSFSPEFQLAAACCMWPPGATRASRMDAALDRTIDWQLFLRVVRRQRIAGLAFHAIRSSGANLPEDALQPLHTAAAKVAQQSLRFAGETIRLTHLLQSAGIATACLKGVTLSQLAFGQLALRHSRDIDLLVSPAEALKADQLMQKAGYRMTMPIGTQTERHRRTWMRLRKHFEYMHPESRIQVELHWRLFDNEHLTSSPHTPLADAWQPVSIPGAPGPLLTLAPRDLLLYLCVHGANHMWFRLKWIADVHALLAQGTEDDLERLMHDSRTFGMLRPVNQAMHLSQRLFGEPALPPAAPASVSALVNSALRAMTSGDAATELEQVPFGTSRVALARYRLRHHWRFWLDEARSGLLDEQDRASSGLPPSLSFLLPLLRLPLWITRRIAGLGRSNR